MRRKLFGLYGGLVLFNTLAWFWACAAFHGYPLLLGVALLAYSLGLRHAVDADHIAAIDNVTRKLMQVGQRPVSVGLFFSLGHSTVVVLASILLASTATAVQERLHRFGDVGGIVGTTVSALFLFAIALMNALILRSAYRVFRRVRSGGAFVDVETDLLFASRGVLTRLFRPLFKLISRSWHMYPLGFLFGLGFDTATEIGVLGISATQATKGLPIWSIMVFPVLFTAGMSLIDSLDGTLMLGAYGWAFINPFRRLYYNMTITSVSVVIAVLVGSIEALGLLADTMNLKGPLWNVVNAMNEHFGMVGYVIIGVFLISWLLAVANYRIKGYDDMNGERLLPRV
jgi:nickel/cobalt transporter (NiCoT) family protein